MMPADLYRLAAVMLFSLVVLLAGAVLSLQTGAVPLPASSLLDSLTGQLNPAQQFILVELRLPRLLVAMLAGAALGCSGALMQAITRNPLASPGLMGITPGVALAVVLSLVLFSPSLMEMLLAGLMGGLATGALVFLIASRHRLQPVQLTLIGVSISLFATAAIMSLLVFASAEANGLYFWLTGSLINRTWSHLSLLQWLVPLVLMLAWGCARPLNLMHLGEEQAQAAGLNLLRWRALVGFLVVVMIATTVSVTGPVGFVGLAAPHAIRLLMGQPFGACDHRQLLPLSALMGACLLVLADTLSRQTQMPAGVIAALAGGPVFLLLIHHQGKHYAR
ncbi:MAG: iron ABC transporter permease [Marinobacterium sp.]|nr:iron ABC transporter permease [Marinobacterium sp.]